MVSNGILSMSAEKRSVQSSFIVHMKKECLTSFSTTASDGWQYDLSNRSLYFRSFHFQISISRHILGAGSC
jgi:hypothetical protein